MKFLIISALALTCSMSFADTFRATSTQEKMNFCKAVDKVLEEESMDMAVNFDMCPKAFIRVKGNTIEGNVPFLSPGRHFTLKCTAEVKGRTIKTDTIHCR